MTPVFPDINSRMMRLAKDFLTRKVSPEIMSRGSAYYLKKKVFDVEKIEQADFLFSCAGSEGRVYHGAVFLAEQLADCSCPYFQRERKECKHIAAVLLAMTFNFDVYRSGRKRATGRQKQVVSEPGGHSGKASLAPGNSSRKGTIRVILWPDGYFSLLDYKPGREQPFKKNIPDFSSLKLSGQDRLHLAILQCDTHFQRTMKERRPWGLAFNSRLIGPENVTGSQGLFSPEGNRLRLYKKKLRPLFFLLRLKDASRPESKSFLLVKAILDEDKFHILRPGQEIFIRGEFAPRFSVNNIQKALAAQKSAQLLSYLADPPPKPAVASKSKKLAAYRVDTLHHNLGYSENYYLNRPLAGSELEGPFLSEILPRLSGGHKLIPDLNARGPLPALYLSLPKNKKQPKLTAHFCLCYTDEKSARRIEKSKTADRLGIHIPPPGWIFFGKYLFRDKEFEGRPANGRVASSSAGNSINQTEYTFQDFVKDSRKLSITYKKYFSGILLKKISSAGEIAPEILFSRPAGTRVWTNEDFVESDTLSPSAQPAKIRVWKNQEIRIHESLLAADRRFPGPEKIPAAWSSGRLALTGARLLDWLENNYLFLRRMGIALLLEDEVRPARLNPPKVRLRISEGSGTDWFAYDIHSTGVDFKKLRQALRAHETGAEVVEFSDGSIADLRDQSWLSALKILEMVGGNTSGKKLTKMDLMRLIRSLETNGQSDESDKIMDLSDSPRAREIQSIFRNISRGQPRDNGKKLTKFGPVNAKLRQYQKDGVAFLHLLYGHRLGGILADDMGLGKTLQILSLISTIHSRRKYRFTTKEFRVLILCPTSAIWVWQNEIDKFTPQIPTVVWYGPDRKNFTSTGKLPDGVILTSYGTYLRDHADINQQFFNLVILDEAQVAKNRVSKSSRAVKQINADSVFCLTGTPIENHLTEFGNIMDIALPGYLGSHRNFQRRFNSSDSSLKELKDLVRPFVLRRTKGEVLKTLPPVQVQDILVPMTVTQAAAYTRAHEKALKELAGKKGSSGIRQLAERLRQLNHLRRVACHPRIHQSAKADPTDSGKIDFLSKHLEEWLVSSNGILVFSQYTDNLDILERFLKKLGHKPFRLDGSTPRKRRINLVNKFQEGEGAIFLISLRAGGTALTLTRADIVIFLDPWWNPAVERQAMDRAHRIGQRNPVFVYKLFSKGTVEEKVLELQRKKQDLHKRLLDGKAFHTAREDMVTALAKAVWNEK